MASEQQIREQKRRLALSLDASRRQLTTSGRGLRHQLNPVHRAGLLIKEHPLRIFGATAAGVALLTWLFRPRRREPKKPLSVPRMLLRWGLSIAKPVVRLLVLDRARGYIQAPGRARGPSPDSLLG